MTGIAEFDLNTPGDWDPSGDAEIAGGKLTLTDPVKPLWWNIHNWDVIPSFDGDGNAVLTYNTLYTAVGDLLPDIGYDDFMVTYWAKLVTAPTSGIFYVFFRRVGGTYIRLQQNQSTPSVIARIYKSDGSSSVRDSEWKNDWPTGGDGTWRQFFCYVLGSRISIVMGAQREIGCRNLVREDPGFFAFQTTLNPTVVTIGGGPGATHDAPTLYYRRHGSAFLKVASAYEFPAGTTSLGSLDILGDLTGGGELPLRALPAYNLYHNDAWSGWTAAPADGDLSGLSVTGGDKILVGIDDGNEVGVGMDNMVNAALLPSDPRYVPEIELFRLTFEYTPTQKYYARRLNDVTAGRQVGEDE